MIMNSSKVFDIIRHDLTIAKLRGPWFLQDDLQYIRSYLTNTQQIVQVNSNFHYWESIIEGQY